MTLYRSSTHVGARIPLKRDGEFIFIQQFEVPGCVRLSFNPDDDRFYVDRPDMEYPGDWKTVGMHRWHRNATRQVRQIIMERPVLPDWFGGGVIE